MEFVIATALESRETPSSPEWRLGSGSLSLLVAGLGSEDMTLPITTLAQSGTGTKINPETGSSDLLDPDPS